MRDARTWLIWIVWDFTGARFVWEKIWPPANPRSDNHRPSSTFVLWVIGIYAAMYGIAAQKYENRVDAIENKADLWAIQLVNEKTRNAAIDRAAAVQNLRTAPKPELTSPISIIRALFSTRSEKYSEIVDLVKESIEPYKESLSRRNLRRLDLSNLDFYKGRFINAKLDLTNLSGSDLWYANFDGASMREVMAKDTNFRHATLTGTDLSDADLRGAQSLTVEQLCTAKSLTGVRVDKALLDSARDQCPAKL